MEYFQNEIEHLVGKAEETYQMERLIGEDDGAPALMRLEKALLRGLARIKEIENHKHEWTETGFCSGCTMDGNA